VRRWSLVGAVALVVFSAATIHTGAAGKLKIGFVYLGPIGDLGWTYQHEVGRRAVVAAFGDRVETTYLENVPEGSKCFRFGLTPNALQPKI
jgi:simple sugar transport system substrate-binding protein